MKAFRMPQGGTTWISPRQTLDFSTDKFIPVLQQLHHALQL